MKIVIIGGTGLIGTKLASKLRQKGHEVIAASPSTGVNTITGEGLDRALSGAEIVVDVANSPSFEDRAVLKFFETSGRNLLAAEAAASVRHHVALSVVGVDRLGKLVRDRQPCVVLTGAGISTESGIPDFRSPSGIWARYDPLEYASIDAFLAEPAKVWDFYGK